MQFDYKDFKCWTLKDYCKFPSKGYQYSKEPTKPIKSWDSWKRPPTLAVSPRANNITILDLDFIRPCYKDKHKSHPVYKYIEKGIHKQTFAVKTPSGGLHLYFKWVPELTHTNNKEFQIDIREPSVNGYVVAPDSVVTKIDTRDPNISKVCIGKYRIINNVEPIHMPIEMVNLLVNILYTKTERESKDRVYNDRRYIDGAMKYDFSDVDVK